MRSLATVAALALVAAALALVVAESPPDTPPLRTTNAVLAEWTAIARAEQSNDGGAAVAQATLDEWNRVAAADNDQTRQPSKAAAATSVDETPIGAAAIGYAIDVLEAVPTENFICMRNVDVTVVVCRIYGPANGGNADQAGLSNVLRVVQAGLDYELVVTPVTPAISPKSGAAQFNEAYAVLNQRGIRFGRIWLQVTSPVHWGTNFNSNVVVIRSFIDTARSQGIAVGIYTNWYDWNEITQMSPSISPDQIWYWSVNGLDRSGESFQSFTDYIPFSNMPRAALVKQFGIGEKVCTQNVNKNIFVASNGAFATPNKIDWTQAKASGALRQANAPIEATAAASKKSASDYYAM